MYSQLLEDWKYFTNIPNSNLVQKIRRVKNNPGMKMVLMNRFINETPKYLFFIYIVAKFFYGRMIFKYGIDLPLNCIFGRNLRIYHFGGIIINPASEIGNNVTIMHGVTLGNNMKDHACPVIGNNVFIGAGAKVLGNITIANNVKIGANAVVLKSIEDENVTAVGIPAKIIKN